MTEQLHDLLVDIVVGKISALAASRQPGHCIRINELPSSIADDACAALQGQLSLPDMARVVVPTTEYPWQVTPTQAVSLRNEESPTLNGVLVIFIPPESRLSVEDSIGASTFEVVRFDDLPERARREALTRVGVMNPESAATAAAVVDEVLRDARYGITELRATEYLLNVANTASAAAAGVELTILGLLPDAGLVEYHQHDGIRRRLQVNDVQIQSLTAPVAAAERLRELPIDRGTSHGKSLTQVLKQSIDDGASDRFVITERLREAADAADYGRWGLDSDVGRPRRFEIIDLHGDFDWDASEPTVTKADPSIGVKFVCDPAATSIPSAYALRLDVLGVGRDFDDVFDTGVSATKRALPRLSASSWKRKIAVGGSDGALDAGLYRFRLALLAKDSTEIASKLGPVFRVAGSIDEPKEVSTPVLGLADAAIKAVAEGLASESLHSRKISFDHSDRSVRYHIRYEGLARAWVIEIPRVLVDLEQQLLTDPSLRGLEVDIEGPQDGESWLQFGAKLPEEFVEARSALFQKLRASPLVDGAPVHTTLLADLAACKEEIDAYVAAWSQSLEQADPQTVAALLSTDQVHLQYMGSLVGILLAPTHPIRIAWLARFEHITRGWAVKAEGVPHEDLAAEAAELASSIDEIVPLNLPHVLVENGIAFRPTDALSRGWGLWAPVGAADQITTASRARSWLDLPSWRLGRTGETELVGRVSAYLESHPYVRRLVINFVQPGEGDLLIRLLGQLLPKFRHNDLSFVLRLFGDTADAALGQALDSFMLDPEGAPSSIKRDVAEELSRPSADPLTPKLSYSKHEVSDLTTRPEDYAAHISVFLDWFELTATSLPEPPSGRALFAGGIVVEPVQQFMQGDDRLSPSWVSAVSGSEPGAVADALESFQKHTARLLGGSGVRPVPALRLEIDSVRQAVLDAVHRSSDWVVVVDAVFSDEYLDRPAADSGRPTYVIDMQSGANRPGGRNVVVSSRVREEQSAPLSAAGARFGFDVPEAARTGLMDSLHLLGAGVALRLLMDEQRGKEALSLALAAKHLEATGILRHALIVPVDMHQDLFTEAQQRGDTSSVRRTDLAIIQLDPALRRIGIHLVEVKVRRSLGESGVIPEALANEIRDQLQNTDAVLRQRLFGAKFREMQGSLAAALRLQRLTELLRRYLSRAARHGLMGEVEVADAARFVESLQDSFSLGTSFHGLIFSADAAGARVEDRGGVSFTVLGAEYVRQMLETPGHAPTVIAGRGSDDELRTVFGTVSDWTELREPGVEKGLNSARRPPSDRTDHERSEYARPEEDVMAESGPLLQDVELIGSSAASDQFGIIGVRSSSARNVAIDMSGTNVVSVFGVQGSGKSYTVGAILEAALAVEPGLNRLPSPLGAVVFHYSANQSYLPEFVSMRKPNSEAYSAALSEFGASPRGLDDVVVLVPDAVLERRRAEYGSAVEVFPIHIGADELSLSDWKMLMGIAEGNQMYAKSMTLLLGGLRDGVTLARLRDAINGSGLNHAQKATAIQRTDFVEPYVREGAQISALMRPGRLLVVDLRDELIDKGEALALFMVLLSIFTQAKADGRNYNKIVVFDEAHKYMNDPALTEAITENVREMRHKGTSIVIASQDPPSVPTEIVELSNIIVTHKFTSPAWLRHLQKISTAFADMKGSQFNELTPGLAYVWASGNPKFHRPQRVKMRARLTMHGGETRRATE